MAVTALIFLSGCNTGSFSEGLRPVSQPQSVALTESQARPTEPVANETALAADPQASPRAQAALQNNTPPARTNIAPVAFLPVTGAPQSTVANLAGAIRRAAQQQSVPVVVSTEQGARYQIKGYFSALNDGGATTLVYVWDVLDANGTRIHRISGQEKTSPVSGDPWSGITPDLLERVAQSTMSSLRSWMQTRRAG